MKIKIKNKILAITVIVLVFGLTSFVFWRKGLVSGEGLANNLGLSVKFVSAQEMYPMFECPCCGKPIDQCTCPMAKERMAFIDGITLRRSSEYEAVMAYIKKYGLESFIDKDKQKEFKEKLIQQAPSNRPIISINPESYNFGDISQKKGIASHFFEIGNGGKSDLKISRIETSCGCTSASIVYQEKEGPRFSMPGHGVNEKIKNWQVAIPPGETAQLKVYYDPKVHKDFRGAATRTVSVFSNDPIDFEKKVQIDLNQID